MISLYFADVFALLRKRALGGFEVALAQKVKLQHAAKTREQKVVSLRDILILA